MQKFSGFMADYEEAILGSYAVSSYKEELMFADPNKSEMKDNMTNFF